MNRRILMSAIAALALGASACGSGGLEKLNHIVVIYQENHSFDNLYGELPGADGLQNAAAAAPQVDAGGTAYATLPFPGTAPFAPFPTNLPNAPFPIESYVAATAKTPDLIHRFYTNQAQIDGGGNDRFVLASDAKGLAMGYYHTANLPMYPELQKYTVCDRFFQAAFGGSFLNHMWLIAAATPVFPAAPASMIASWNPATFTGDGAVTPDFFVVNTAFTVNAPHPAGYDPTKLVPNQTFPTIGDRLGAAKVSWAWYAGGWNLALAGTPPQDFQFHHQPFAYFQAYADGTQAKADHLKDEQDFIAAARAGTLPAVSFVKPLGPQNEHPGYADLVSGQNHVLELIDAVRNGPNWKDTAIIVTYDENGGFYDHVAPPAGDRWGPGTRIPALVISPFAKKGHVDHTGYDTTSILATIEHRWNLKPLGDRDAAARPMTAAFDF